MGQLRFQISTDSGIQLPIVLQHAQNILAHLLSGEMFRLGLGEIQPQLNSLAMHRCIKLEVGQ